MTLTLVSPDIFWRHFLLYWAWIKHCPKVTLYHYLILTLNYCIELLFARYYLFYLCRGQFHQSHQLAWQNVDCSKHHCTTETMFWKKCVNIHCEEKTVNLAYLTELLSRNHCWGSKTISKNSCEPRHSKTIELWNKVLCTDKLKFEIFQWSGRFYVQQRFSERAGSPCITPTVKHGGGSVMGWGDFANCKVSFLHQVKGKLNQTGYHTILQHDAIPFWTQLVAQGFVLLLDHHHHHVIPLARISLSLSRHFSLSFIASGRSSGLHPVSSHSCWMYVRAGRPAFARPYVGVHCNTSLMSLSLLLQQCLACLVRLTWIVFVMGGRGPYSWCLVRCCCQDLFNIARSILV